MSNLHINYKHVEVYEYTKETIGNIRIYCGCLGTSNKPYRNSTFYSGEFIIQEFNLLLRKVYPREEYKHPTSNQHNAFQYSVSSGG